MRRRRDMSELPCLRRGFRHLPFAGRPLSATASTHLDRANLLTLSRAGSAGLLAGTTAAPRVGSRIAWMALLWGGPSDRYLIPGLLVRYRCPRPTERPWQRTTSPGSDHGPDRRDRTNHLRCGHHPTHTARGSAMPS